MTLFMAYTSDHNKIDASLSKTCTKFELLLHYFLLLTHELTRVSRLLITYTRIYVEYFKIYALIICTYERRNEATEQTKQVFDCMILF